MPTLAVGMLRTPENDAMPTASVGMAPVTKAFRNKNYLFILIPSCRSDCFISRPQFFWKKSSGINCVFS